MEEELSIHNAAYALRTFKDRYGLLGPDSWTGQEVTFSQFGAALPRVVSESGSENAIGSPYSALGKAGSSGSLTFGKAVSDHSGSLDGASDSFVQVLTKVPYERQLEEAECLVPLLQCSHVLRKLPATYQRALCRIASFSLATKGENLYSRGDASDAFYLVLSGRVRIYLSSQRGEDPVLLSEVKANHCFGELALLDSRPRTNDATVDSDMVELMVIPKEEYQLTINALRAEDVLRTLSLPPEERSEEDLLRVKNVISDHITFLRNHDEGLQIPLCRNMKLLHFNSPGEYVFCHGDQSDGMYCVFSAQVEVVLQPWRKKKKKQTAAMLLTAVQLVKEASHVAENEMPTLLPAESSASLQSESSILLTPGGQSAREARGSVLSLLSREGSVESSQHSPRHDFSRGPSSGSTVTEKQTIDSAAQGSAMAGRVLLAESSAKWQSSPKGGELAIQSPRRTRSGRFIEDLGADNRVSERRKSTVILDRKGSRRISPGQQEIGMPNRSNSAISTGRLSPDRIPSDAAATTGRTNSVSSQAGQVDSSETVEQEQKVGISSRFNLVRQAIATEVEEDKVVAKYTDGDIFGEPSFFARDTRAASVRVTNEGYLIKLHKKDYVRINQENKDRKSQEIHKLLREALEIDETASLEFMKKLAHYFVPRRIGSGQQLGVQGRYMEDLYIVKSGSITASTDVKMERIKNSNKTGDESIQRNLPVTVATVGTKDNLGLAALWSNDGFLMTNYTSTTDVHILQAPLAKVVSLLETSATTIAALKLRETTKTQRRAHRLVGTLALLKKEGWTPTRTENKDLRVFQHILETSDRETWHHLHGDEEKEPYQEGEEFCSREKSQLLQDRKFRGAKLHEKRERETIPSRKQIVPTLKVNDAILTHDRLAALCTKRSHRFAPTSFLSKDSPHGKADQKYPMGCWWNQAVPKTGGWLGSTESQHIHTESPGRFAAAAKQEVARKKEEELNRTNPVTVTSSAKEIFTDLGRGMRVSVLLPGEIDRETLFDGVLPSARYGGLKFLPRTGRRPRFENFVLPSTVEFLKEEEALKRRFRLDTQKAK